MVLQTALWVPLVYGGAALLAIGVTASTIAGADRSVRPSVAALALLGVAVTVWSVTTLAIRLGFTLGDYFFVQLQFAAPVVAISAWLLVAVVGATDERRHQPVAVVLGVCSFVLLSVIFTTDMHSLYITDFERRTVDGVTRYYTETGPLFWIGAVYLQLCSLVSVPALISAAAQLRPSAVAVGLLSILCVYGPNLLFVFGVTVVDYSPLGFAAGAVGLLYLLRVDGVIGSGEQTEPMTA
jgi:hypothetical protein